MLSVCKKLIILALEFRIDQQKKIYMRFKYLILLAFMFLTAIGLKAQTMELGAFVGGSYYLGDLNPALHFNQTQFSYGVVGRYNANNRWAFKASWYRGMLKGDDLKTKAIDNRDLNFQTVVNDFSVVAEFNFWDYFTGSKKSNYAPYIFGGASMFTYNPRTLDGVALRPLGTEGQNVGFDGRSPYGSIGFAIPFGVGFKYSVSERVGLGFEWSMRKTFTDYIDDVSTTYASNPDQIADPTQTHSEGMQRGNRENDDWYGFAGITLTYKFNLFSSKRCDNLNW